MTQSAESGTMPATLLPSPRSDRVSPVRRSLPIPSPKPAHRYEAGSPIAGHGRTVQRIARRAINPMDTLSWPRSCDPPGLFFSRRSERISSIKLLTIRSKRSFKSFRRVSQRPRLHGRRDRLPPRVSDQGRMPSQRLETAHRHSQYVGARATPSKFANTRRNWSHSNAEVAPGEAPPFRRSPSYRDTVG
jgi:hypothetical protein